jgi:hypothetical protein
MPHRNVGHCFYNIFPSCLNCSSSEAETRILCVYVPLGFARGTTLGSARGATLGSEWGTPRLRSGYNARLRSNCSSSEAETRNPMHIHPPLGFARGTDLGFARGTHGSQTVRRAKPRREIQCIYTNPSAPLGVQCSAPLGVQPSAPLGVQSQQPHRVDIIITTLELLSWYR